MPFSSFSNVLAALKGQGESVLSIVTAMYLITSSSTTLDWWHSTQIQRRSHKLSKRDNPLVKQVMRSFQPLSCHPCPHMEHEPDTNDGQSSPNHWKKRQCRIMPNTPQSHQWKSDWSSDCLRLKWSWFQSASICGMVDWFYLLTRTPSTTQKR